MSSQAIAASLGVKAVIADARRRQRRRRLVAAVAAVLVVGLVAVIALGRSGTAQPQVVKIYFGPSATSRQIARTVAAVRAEHGVKAVSLITRKAALAYERRRYPSLVAGLAYNPFPDSIAVRVNGSDAARVIADVKRALPFGISNVSGG